MTDTKPTPQTDAIDTYQPFIVSEPKYNAMAELCRTLERELAAIKSQPVPVEPEQIKMMRYDEPEGRSDYERAITDYIDSLQSALQVAQQERDAERERGDQWETTATNLLARAEKAEAELAALRLELGQITGEIPYGN